VQKQQGKTDFLAEQFARLLLEQAELKRNKRNKNENAKSIQNK